MIHPLVTLWRHHTRVTFYEAGAAARSPWGDRSEGGAAASMLGRRRTWASRDEIVGYLRFWLGEPAALTELMWMLRREQGAVAGPRRDPVDILQALAARIAGGELVVMEETARGATPARLTLPPSSSAAATLAAMPALSSVPAVPNPAFLLPALETVQIEGAQVRPELEQGLEQVSLSLGQIDQAQVSLEPAPTKVADISKAMGSATDQASGKLGEL